MSKTYKSYDEDSKKTIVNLYKSGKMRLEGKEYLMQDGDIVYFRFNV